MPVTPDSEQCATCHQSISDEWHTPQHENKGVDCQVCHNPHAQAPVAGASSAREETGENAGTTPSTGEISGIFVGPETCQSCHQELFNSWQSTRHAQAFSSPIFQKDWVEEGSNAFCLECHTTGFNPETKDYTHEGVTCESCHGPFQPGHPETMMAVEPDAALCANCHKSTTDEWRASKHGDANIQCQSCHNPHSQTPRAANVTELCTNCHKAMEDSFTHGTHANAGLECSNCHMYTSPRTGDPIMGLVATGHTFTVGSDTCIGCHKDTVHTRDTIIQLSGEAVPTPEITTQKLEQKISEQEMTIETLEARGSVRLYTGLAQGAIVGLVTGGVAAWVVSKRIRVVEEDENEQEKDES